jgi:hypothetical protein
MDLSDARARIHEVLLDGELLPDCIAADEELGTAVIRPRDAHGQLLRDGAGRTLTQLVRGAVLIRRMTR